MPGGGKEIQSFPLTLFFWMCFAAIEALSNSFGLGFCQGVGRGERRDGQVRLEMSWVLAHIYFPESHLMVLFVQVPVRRGPSEPAEPCVDLHVDLPYHRAFN